MVRNRRMVRSYEQRAVPAAAITRIVGRELRAPSVGFVQGSGFLVLLEPTDLARFREVATPAAMRTDGAALTPIGAVSVG